MRPTSCRAHAAAIVDLIEGSADSRLDSVLVDALRRCERCRPDVEAILLGSWAVQRAWQVAREVEPPETAWPKVRELTRRPRGDVWRGRAHVLGIGMAAVLIALLSSAQLAATIESGRGRELVESRPISTVNRAYDPPPVAVTHSAASVTQATGVRVSPGPAARAARALAVDRQNTAEESRDASPAKPAPAHPVLRSYPSTL